MKKLAIILFILIGFFSFTQMAAADQVTLVGGYGPYQTGLGGEFTFLPTPAAGALADLVSLYSSKASGFGGYNGTFQTFCLEKNEYISANGKYDAVLNTAAVNGGVGGPEPDPISKGTAYLYYLFATGALTGYNYSGTVGERKASAADLQNAIWYLEYETGSVSNQFVTAVITEFGNINAAQADYEGDAVKVLNLYESGHGGSTNPGYFKQDQLILTRVPEPFTILLLSIGLFGVAVIRRKL